MILDVHADIVHGKKQQVLLDVARGAYAAGMKVNITTASNVDKNNYSLLWRHPNKGELVLENIINVKGRDKIFFLNNNYFNNYICKNNYRRLTYRSIYDNEATYPNKNEEDAKSFYEDHKLDLKPWNRDGTHVVIFPNNSRTFGSHGQNVEDWLFENIESCLHHGIENIVVKYHPTEHKDLVCQQHKNKVIVDNSNIFDLIKKYNLKFALIYNSGAATVCLLEGIPTFIQGPNNLARKFSNMESWDDVKNINYDIDRSEYIKEASEKLWLFDDIKQGKAWNRLLEKL